jgi:hypothetical protein
VWSTTYSNAFYDITPGRGGIKSMIDKASDYELFDTRVDVAHLHVRAWPDAFSRIP